MMLFEKTCIGEESLENLLVKYYVIKKDNIYGIEIEEAVSNQMVCDYEYFTHRESEAINLAHKMKNGSVTITTMIDIIDDYIN